MKLYVIMKKNYKTLFNKCFYLNEHNSQKNSKKKHWLTYAYLRKKDAKKELQRICNKYSFNFEDLEIVTFEAKRDKKTNEKVIVKKYCDFCGKEFKYETYRILQGHLNNFEFKYNNKKFVISIDVRITKDIKNLSYDENIVKICKKCEKKHKEDLKRVIVKTINKTLFGKKRKK